MKTHFAFFAGCVLLPLILNIPQTGPRMWTFDKDKLGEIAPGFRSEVGEWKVTTDAGAPGKGRVLGQFAKSARPVFNVTLVDGTDYKDLDLSVGFKAVAGEVDQGGGLVWRARDAKNYYVARYNPLENNFRVYKVAQGVRTQFASVDVRRSDGWHTLRVTMQGDHIEFYYDAKKYLDLRDSTFPESGRIGLWTKADAQTLFDNLTARSF